MTNKHETAVLGETISPCSRCGAVLPTRLEDVDNDVYMVRICPEHGAQRHLYFKDSGLFKAAQRFIPKGKGCARPACVDGTPCRQHLSRSTTVLLNVTDRCNLACPTCLASSGSVDGGEPTLEQIASAFPGRGVPNKPTVCLIGGEPTLREDLPDIVRLLRNNGYVPRLNTNGLRLESATLRRSLREAGLDWIILQFDGLTEESSLALRGRKLAARKIRLIETLLADGFRVQLAVMTVADVNGPEMHDILRFAFESGIFWVSFYPHTLVGRAPGGAETTHVADLMRIVDESSGGMLRRDDFLAAMKLWSAFYRVLPAEPFRQKLSTFPTILVKNGSGYVPFTRLLGMGPEGRPRPWKLLELAPSALRAYRYRTSRPDERLLFLSIEKFHDHDTLDLHEASACHMCYMTERGTVAFDIFNRFHRDARSW